MKSFPWICNPISGTQADYSCISQSGIHVGFENRQPIPMGGNEFMGLRSPKEKEVVGAKKRKPMGTGKCASLKSLGGAIRGGMRGPSRHSSSSFPNFEKRHSVDPVMVLSFRNLLCLSCLQSISISSVGRNTEQKMLIVGLRQVYFLSISKPKTLCRIF